GTGGSKWQELPPLQAAPGSTALAGQVLKLNGWPLQHVTLEMDGSKAHTDSTGRFLLRGLTAGHHVLWIDATTANHDKSFYGTYEVGVTILPNKTNVLNYTIWMTRLDMAHAITIASPTTAETVLTNPSIRKQQGRGVHHHDGIVWISSRDKEKASCRLARVRLSVK